MKAIVSKNDLIAGITRTAGALPQRPSSMQILQNILLNFSEEDGAIRSTATDLEMAVIVDTPATVQKGGALTVPGKKLLEIVRELQEGEVTLIVAENNRLTVKSGKTRLTLLGTGREDYPSIPAVTGEVAVTVAAEAFCAAVRKTIVAASRDDARSFLTGANLIINAQKTRLVATDGHRLAIADFEAKAKKGRGPADVNVIIPSRILNEVASNVGTGNIEIAVGETNVLITTQNGTYYSRLIAEKFPDYEKIIPKSSDRKIEISRQRFSDALRRVSPFTNLRTHSVLVSVKADHLVVSAETPEFGEAQDEVDAKVAGSAMEITFNTRYIQDMLKVVSGDDLTIEMGSKLAPAVFTSSSEKGYTYILMPLRG